MNLLLLLWLLLLLLLAPAIYSRIQRCVHLAVGTPEPSDKYYMAVLSHVHHTNNLIHLRICSAALASSNSYARILFPMPNVTNSIIYVYFSIFLSFELWSAANHLR